MASSTRVRPSGSGSSRCSPRVRTPGVWEAQVNSRPSVSSVTRHTAGRSFGWVNRAVAPTASGPGSPRSARDTEAVHSGQRGTSTSTAQTCSTSAAISVSASNRIASSSRRRRSAPPGCRRGRRVDRDTRRASSAGSGRPRAGRPGSAGYAGAAAPPARHRADLAEHVLAAAEPLRVAAGQPVAVAAPDQLDADPPPPAAATDPLGHPAKVALTCGYPIRPVGTSGAYGGHAAPAPTVICLTTVGAV